VRRALTILLSVILGLVGGILISAPFKGRTVERFSDGRVSRPNLARLSSPELEQLAYDVLSTLSNQGTLATPQPIATAPDSQDSSRQIRLGIKNARRLLPIARELTIESLRDLTKNPNLSKEAKLIRSVRVIVLDSQLADFSEVRDDDLSVIRIGKDYATCLTSDDEAMLLLGHELTHVAARAGRLSKYIDAVNETALRSAQVSTSEPQKEELACDFAGAEVLKRFISARPTSESSTDRLSRVFGYELPAERLKRAWGDFCASYDGDPGDKEHLSQSQTVRSLLALDPEFKALIHQDALPENLCRTTP
jgi:hypothetical protein